ncbi:MAG TPA: arginine repressor [Bacteroidales bacterium]|nr:arginine repressor [Bacteroidales bacterium]HOK75682.1 arginine repressor [Bacteroidales bacterium]HOM40656.1 arginine repressor [Bacteroidales bacterium]HOU30505.1 arginine repressor [Bacteroidales bacterium]HPP92757.1 arginine repressor [Bacteroidales bacterium]
MQRISRLIAIENIIRSEKVSSQEEIIRKLGKMGIKCTQATLSRSLKQLGVVKVPDGRGGYRYSFVSDHVPQIQAEAKYDLVNVIRSIIEVKGMILIKTSPGYANSVAITIDNYGRYEIAGTIAGDDTLLVIPRDNVSPAHVRNILEMIFPGIHSMTG